MTTYLRKPIVERIERDDRATTVVLAGELDLTTISELHRALDAECCSTPSHLVIDIAAVEFIDSAALHLFITMSNRLADGGGSLEIVQVPERLRRTFSITNLDALLLGESTDNAVGRQPAGEVRDLMNDRRIDVVQVSLGRGPVGLPWKSRQDLLAEFRELDSHRSLRDDFEAVGTSRPVELTPEQKGELFDTIELWSTRVGYSGLPEGIFELRSALVDDIDAARSATD